MGHPEKMARPMPCQDPHALASPDLAFTLICVNSATVMTMDHPLDLLLIPGIATPPFGKQLFHS